MGSCGGAQQWVLTTTGCVFLETTGFMSWDYSVQVMRKRQTHCERQEQHFSPQSLREKRWRRGTRGGGHPSNSARDRQTYRVLSRYSVHRINPQCVLTNTTQLPPHWFRVCRRSPLSSRSTPSDPRPQALKPPHRQGRPSVFPGETHIRMQ